MDKVLNIIGIKSPQGIYITNYNSDSSYNRYSNLNHYIINDKVPKSTFDQYWNFIEEEPKKITQPQSSKRDNYRYVLKDKSMISDKIPLQLQKDEVSYNDEDYGLKWKEAYSHLSSLYNLEWDEIEQPDKIIDFTYEQILEVDELRNIKDINWEIYRTSWTHEGTRKVNIDDFKYQLIDKIIFPKIYYQQHCPVTLPSKRLYDIIRFYIKSNIDLKVAEITSDYDFCFTVKKRVKLQEPKEIKVEQLKANGKSFSKPKFTTKIHHYAGSYEIFKMTHKEKGYSGYPILPDLIAENINKLEEKVDNILNKLIEFINKPVSICPCCNGTGLEQKENNIDLNEMIEWK